jgi:hypothetical protein
LLLSFNFYRAFCKFEKAVNGTNDVSITLSLDEQVLFYIDVTSLFVLNWLCIGFAENILFSF